MAIKPGFHRNITDTLDSVSRKPLLTAALLALVLAGPAEAGTTSATGSTKATTAAPTIVITSNAADSAINAEGATLLGKVSGSLVGVTSVTAEVGTDAGSIRNVEVNATSGEFAYRVFAADMTVGKPVVVSFKINASFTTTPQTFSFVPTTNLAQRGLGLAASRLSFGWTPELQYQITSEGFQNWVNAQLNPNSITETKIGVGAWATMENKALTQNSTYTGLAGPWDFINNAFDDEFFRAAYSDRQLQEVMTLFWANHFWTNWSANDWHEAAKWEEYKMYRSLALGSFKDLLFASAHSGIMMVNLDNNLNLNNGRYNENYARELMELHTVGTSAGYTDADIQAVAKILTGWTAVGAASNQIGLDLSLFNKNVDDWAFQFQPQNHDTSDKTLSFLGNLTIKGISGANGIQEGEQLLTILANHPLTQQHICSELVQLLVADTPPAAPLARCVKAWGTTGIIKNLIAAIVLDPDYLNSVRVNTKVRTPFKYAIRLLRNFGTIPSAAEPQIALRRVLYLLANSGMNMETFEFPTGFSEDSATWLGGSSLAIRSNMASSLYESWGGAETDFGNIPGLTTRVSSTVYTAASPTAEAAAAAFLGYFLNDSYTPDEYDAVVTALKAPKGGYVNSSDLEARSRKAMRLLMSLPSYYAG